MPYPAYNIKYYLVKFNNCIVENTLDGLIV